MGALWADLGDWVKGVTCPRCHEPSVVYNGNYFCGWNECGWVMPERHTAVHNHILRVYLSQRLDVAEAKGDAREAALMRGYLNALPRVKV